MGRLYPMLSGTAILAVLALVAVSADARSKRGDMLSSNYYGAQMQPERLPLESEIPHAVRPEVFLHAVKTNRPQQESQRQRQSLGQQSTPQLGAMQQVISIEGGRDRGVLENLERRPVPSTPSSQHNIISIESGREHGNLNLGMGRFPVPSQPQQIVSIESGRDHGNLNNFSGMNRLPAPALSTPSQRVVAIEGGRDRANLENIRGMGRLPVSPAPSQPQQIISIQGGPARGSLENVRGMGRLPVPVPQAPSQLQQVISIEGGRDRGNLGTLSGMERLPVPAIPSLPAAPVGPTTTPVPLVKHSFESDAAGNYDIEYYYADNTARLDHGRMKTVINITNGEAIPIHVKSGSVSWTSPEGKPIKFEYTADEHGYHPTGDILPTPPPTPEAILKMLKTLPKLKEEEEKSHPLPGAGAGRPFSMERNRSPLLPGGAGSSMGTPGSGRPFLLEQSNLSPGAGRPFSFENKSPLLPGGSGSFTGTLPGTGSGFVLPSAPMKSTLSMTQQPFSSQYETKQYQPSSYGYAAPTSKPAPVPAPVPVPVPVPTQSYYSYPPSDFQSGSPMKPNVIPTSFVPPPMMAQAPVSQFRPMPTSRPPVTTVRPPLPQAPVSPSVRPTGSGPFGSTIMEAPLVPILIGPPPIKEPFRTSILAKTPGAHFDSAGFKTAAHNFAAQSAQRALNRFSV